MMDSSALKVSPCGETTTGAKWVNIAAGSAYVGKARCRTDGSVLTVYSIMIFTQFQGRGYGRQTINLLKHQFPVIVADRVRPTAVGFWRRMGFRQRSDGSWEYSRPG